MYDMMNREAMAGFVRADDRTASAAVRTVYSENEIHNMDPLTLACAPCAVSGRISEYTHRRNSLNHTRPAIAVR